jgi:hypothetical protein
MVLPRNQTDKLHLIIAGMSPNSPVDFGGRPFKQSLVNIHTKQNDSPGSG